MNDKLKAPTSVHDEAKYVQEKAERFMFKCPGFPMGDTRAPYLLKDFIRTIVEDCKPRVSREKIFVEHIEQHLKDMKIDGKVLCKICGKDIDEINEEAEMEEER